MKKFTTALLVGFALLLSGCTERMIDRMEEGKSYRQWQEQQHIERENAAERDHELQISIIDDARWRQYSKWFFEVLYLLALIGVPAAAGWACWYVFLKKEAAVEHHKLENEERQKQRKDIIALVTLAPANERVKVIESLGAPALLSAPPS